MRCELGEKFDVVFTFAVVVTGTESLAFLLFWGAVRIFPFLSA